MEMNAHARVGLCVPLVSKQVAPKLMGGGEIAQRGQANKQQRCQPRGGRLHEHDNDLKFRLTRAATDLRQTWNSFERTTLQRGAVDDARRFIDIVVQLEGARAPDDFVEPTRAELDAVQRLEKVFRP